MSAEFEATSEDMIGEEAPRESDSVAGSSQPQGWTVDPPTDLTPEPLAAHATMPPPPLERIIEALLFAGGYPLTQAKARAAIRGIVQEQLDMSVSRLNKLYRDQNRPYVIQRQGDGYVMALRPRFKSVEEDLTGQMREARLSPPAIDVLALIAYRQPILGQEIDAIRGVESGALVRMLVKRGLVSVGHRGEGKDREVEYGTTPRFLQLFNLSSLEDLPQTMDLQQL